MATINWDAIGALAELIGAGAVVATLVYLSTQLKQNTRAVRHASERGALMDGQTWLFKLVENPDLSSLYIRGLRGDDMTAEETLRFRFLLQLLFHHWNHTLRHGVGGLATRADISSVLSTPGGSSYWKRASQAELAELDKGFVAYLNSIVSDIEAESAPR